MSALLQTQCPTVPEELQAQPQWVGWRWETREGKRTKLPINPHTGSLADSTDSTTWGSYTEACAASEGYGLDGIGFVFSAQDEYCGVDLDKVRNPDTGALTDETRTIIENLASYAEISPSGTGVKVFLRGALPGGRRRVGHIEMYDSGRFFTVTGQHLTGTPATVEDRQEALTALYERIFPQATPAYSHRGDTGSTQEERFRDEEVLRLARSARNSEKFTQLWAGEWQNFDYTSQSEADLALASMLAFYTGPGTEAQVDRLFQQSGLYREKWDRQDYRDGTLREVFGRLDEDFYQPARELRLVDRSTADRAIRENSENSESGSASQEWEAPTPLTEYTLPPFPTEALPEWVRQFVEAEAEATQTPPDLAGMLALSTLATAVAGKVDIQVKEGYREPLNLYTVTVLPPANRKSAVFADMTAPLVAWEERAAEESRSEIAEAQERHSLKKAQLEHARATAVKAKPAERGAKEEEVLTLARELSELHVPATPRLIAEDATPEKVASLLAEQGGRLAVLSPEGDVFEIMAGRYSSGTPNLGVFLKGHAGEELRVDRQGRPAEYVQRATLTLGLTVQPEVLRGLADRPGFRGRGLLGRFLYALPVSLVGRRRTDPAPVPIRVREVYTRTVTRLLTVAPGTTLVEGKETPHVLTLSTGAQGYMLWLEGYIEKELGEYGALGSMQDWGGKLFGAVARIAGLLHMAEHADTAAPWGSPVAAHTVEAAWCIGQYLIPQARAAFAEMGTDPAIEEARIVLRWLGRHRETTGANTVTRRDIHQGTKGRFKKAEAIDAPLALLVEYGYLQKQAIHAPRTKGQQPSPSYAINPLWPSHNSHDSHE